MGHAEDDRHRLERFGAPLAPGGQVLVVEQPRQLVVVSALCGVQDLRACLGDGCRQPARPSSSSWQPAARSASAARISALLASHAGEPQNAEVPIVHAQVRLRHDLVRSSTATPACSCCCSRTSSARDRGRPEVGAIGSTSGGGGLSSRSATRTSGIGSLQAVLILACVALAPLVLFQLGRAARPDLPPSGGRSRPRRCP